MKHKTIAITGGIGSGKSAVSAILIAMGFQVVDCDLLARQVATEPHVLQKVKDLLGEEFVSDGQPDRRKIRATIFGNDELYASYSAIFWDEIRLVLQNRVAQFDTVFVEIPVLDAFPFDWDEIWLVESALETRIARVTQRDGVTEENVLNVISKQKQYQIFTRKIANDGSFEDLKKAVEQCVFDAGLILA